MVELLVYSVIILSVPDWDLNDILRSPPHDILISWVSNDHTGFFPNVINVKC